MTPELEFLPDSSNMSPLAKLAQQIWQAGVAAVDSTRLVEAAVQIRHDRRLSICGHEWSLDGLDRVVVIGGGKAGRGMALGIERRLLPVLGPNRLTGWLNVPSDCVVPLQSLHLHAARPAGVNEPTEAGVLGTEEILKLATEITDRDLCIVLLSGGGSALLPAPIAGITLAEKQAVTRFLSQSGATIHQLNTVRKRLSRIKGGGLARKLAGKNAISLIISDVIGDPLDVIASGPTVPDSTTNEAALAVLKRFDPNESHVPAAVWNVLRGISNVEPVQTSLPTSDVINCLIGNNRTAVEASQIEAVKLGFDVQVLGCDRQGIAKDVGREFARIAVERLTCSTTSSRPLCILAGGEPVVKLAETDLPRKGGRNQEVVLSAAKELWTLPDALLERLAMLSGGTDGEDGPTDAAGAWFDLEVRSTANQLRISPEPDLAINNSYHFFEQAGGLLKTGPTHTNVMDLQVLLMDSKSSQ